MEKITYAPLIQHLQESEDTYNAIHHEHELRFGAIEKDIMLRWMVTTVEPIIKAQSNQEDTGRLFQAIYPELLELLGNRLGIIHEKEYQAAWMLCVRNPALTQTAPVRMVRAINGALQSLRTYQPANVESWIQTMDRVVSLCQTLDEFLACGRVVAWMCGMAHLHDKALDSFSILSTDIKEVLTKKAGLAFSTTTWPAKKPMFAGQAGGFAGLGGVFLFPPKVTLINHAVLASDNQSGCALFADQYGKVIITDISFDAKEIIHQSNNEALKSFRSKYGSDLVPFDDITSSVLTETSFVFTRSSSLYLFIYGWSN